jgi:hypothetical protein
MRDKEQRDSDGIVRTGQALFEAARSGDVFYVQEKSDAPFYITL